MTNSNEKNPFQIKILDNKEDIEDACALLYEVFIQQQKWQFSPDNPSQLRIEVRNGKNILIDRFTDRSIWFGVFHEKTLAGCARLTGIDEKGQFATEAYPSSADAFNCIDLSQDKKSRCYEIQRLATKKVYLGKGIVNRLISACFKFCQNGEYSVLAFTHNIYLKSLFSRIGFRLIKEEAFKYEPHDTSPVNFFYAGEKSEVDSIVEKLEQESGKNNAGAIFNALAIAEKILPTPFYWMNTDGIVLGINDLCLKAIGTTRDIIGKNPREFYPVEVAEHILKHNAEVMQKEEILSQEEWIEDITTKERKCFSSVKRPLYDDAGTIIGIVGTSIEITAEKQAEQLKIENERQKIKLEEEARYHLKLRKLAHDVSSPISSLKLLTKNFLALKAPQIQTIQNSLERLLNLTDNFLLTFRNKENGVAVEEEARQPVCVVEHVKALLDQKRVELPHVDISLDVSFFLSEAKINIQPHQFSRALSNIINNAEQASDAEHKKIRVYLGANKSTVWITVSDNGTGMPEHIKQKILTGQGVTHGKENGNGLGMQQVTDMLKHNEGELDILSNMEGGTTIALSFPLYND